MAIGDTVQAGLLRADFSPIQKAGQAQAQANQAFGQTLGGLVDKFYQKKKEKAEKEQLKQAYLKLGMSEEVADAAKNDKDLAGQFINKMNADRTYDLQMDQFNQLKSVQNLQKKKIKQGIANTKADRLRDQEARLKEQTKAEDLDRFIGTREMVDMPIGVQDQNPLMRGVEQPTAQVPQGDYMGNRFMQTELGRSDLTSMMDAGMDPSDALDMASKFEAQVLAKQPKAPTPIQAADLEAKRLSNEKAQIQLNALKNPPARPAPPEPVYMESALNAIDDSITLVDKDSILNPTVGFGSETAKSIGGSDAADLEAALSTITSAVGFKRLQDMREASPTGGALGSVSERELSQLNAALGSISQKQSPEQLKKNLVKIKDHYQKAVDAINAQRIAYNSGLTFKTQDEALKYIQSQKSSNAIKTDQGNYSIQGLSVEAQ